MADNTKVQFIPTLDNPTPEYVRPVTPGMEKYEGNNNAWRGTEDHGVDAQDYAETLDNVEGEDFYAEKEFNPELPGAESQEADEDVVPVRIVSRFPRQITQMETARIPIVNNQAIRVLGADPFRTRAILSCTSVNVQDFYVGNSEQVDANNGYYIQAASLGLTLPLELLTGDEVWVICPTWATNAFNLSVLVERAIDGDPRGNRK